MPNPILNSPTTSRTHAFETLHDMPPLKPRKSSLTRTLKTSRSKALASRVSSPNHTRACTATRCTLINPPRFSLTRPLAYRSCRMTTLIIPVQGLIRRCRSRTRPGKIRKNYDGKELMAVGLFLLAVWSARWLAGPAGCTDSDSSPCRIFRALQIKETKAG